MFVSIIVPCFNAALTIGATIESALEQRDVGVEIVVLDDGSTDRSLEIARTFEDLGIPGRMLLGAADVYRDVRDEGKLRTQLRVRSTAESRPT